MHLFFFSFQRTLLSSLSASPTFKDITKVRYIFGKAAVCPMLLFAAETTCEFSITVMFL